MGQLHFTCVQFVGAVTVCRSTYCIL